MKYDYRIVSQNFGKGTNSSRILIEDRISKKLLKITDLKEEHVSCIYTPKLLSVNNHKFNRLNEHKASYVYECEFIDGNVLSECLIDDELFMNIIKMFVFFFSNNIFVWDCHINNIVVRNRHPYFVDFGGIEKQPFTKKHYIFEFVPPDCPEEFLADNYPESYNTEVFTIYWFADQLIKRCDCCLSKKSMSILTKMHEKKISNRFSSFTKIIEALSF